MATALLPTKLHIPATRSDPVSRPRWVERPNTRPGRANGFARKPTLVFDDHHLAQAQPIHDAVPFLLRHMPPQLRSAIATRD
jgi:hypothetical protein